MPLPLPWRRRRALAPETRRAQPREIVTGRRGAAGTEFLPACSPTAPRGHSPASAAATGRWTSTSPASPGRRSTWSAAASAASRARGHADSPDQEATSTADADTEEQAAKTAVEQTTADQSGRQGEHVDIGRSHVLGLSGGLRTDGTTVRRHAPRSGHDTRERQRQEKEDREGEWRLVKVTIMKTCLHHSRCHLSRHK